jgi:hypothetical protein
VAAGKRLHGVALVEQVIAKVARGKYKLLDGKPERYRPTRSRR